MTAVANPLRTFQTPAELAAYLNTDDKFKKAAIMSSKGPMCAMLLQGELDGLSEITALFNSAKENSQGFGSNTEIKKLIHAYLIFLTNSSSIIDNLISQSIKITNNCKIIIDSYKLNNISVAKEVSNNTKRLFQQSSEMFTSLIKEATALKASDKLVFAVEESGDNPGKENIDALDLTIKKMGNISTRLLNSRCFWESVKNCAEFIADLSGAEAFIDATMDPKYIEEEITGISSRWLELVRVTQLISQLIKSVLVTLKDPLAVELKDSNPQKELLKQHT